MPATNFTRVTAFILLLVYLAVLTKGIVFKRSSVTYYKHYFAREYKRYSISRGWKKANTVPFRTINLYYKSYNRSSIKAKWNLWGNLLGFIPFGILLPIAIPWFRRFIPMLLAIGILTLGFETVQLYTGLGVFDVDDLILNGAGALFGFLLFSITRLLFRRTTKNQQP